jgi:DNA-directed RNA polymerase subunit M/transcription elongation factor TFIIS
MSRVVKAVDFSQVKTINQLMDEYKVPTNVRTATLRHGEMLMNADLLYEAVMQGGTPEVYQAIVNNSNTFYRNDVYFSLPGCKQFIDTSEEMTLVSTESKPLQGPYCPKCRGTNTIYTTNQERSGDEGYIVYIICRDCENGKFKNPLKVEFPPKSNVKKK